MVRDLDITHLRSIVAIADAGGFGRAATTLHVSQSTVSQHVRLLERAIGRPVVERQGRGSRFTTDGERLLREARRILAVHDDALARLDSPSRLDSLAGYEAAEVPGPLAAYEAAEVPGPLAGFEGAEDQSAWSQWSSLGTPVATGDAAP